MRNVCVSLAIVALACLAVPARAQQTKRWTNADMDELRARGGISIIGTEAPAATAESAVTAATPEASLAGPVYADRLQDPVWYANQAADLQTELAARVVTLAQAQASLADARNGRGATGSINMAAGDTYGLIPEDVIADLQAQVGEAQARLEDLADLARRNDIAVGVVRSAV